MTSRISMIQISKEIPFRDSSRYIEIFLSRCAETFGDQLGIYYCAASIICTGLESCNMLLGFTSSLEFTYTNQEDLWDQLAAKFQILQPTDCISGILTVLPIYNLSTWHSTKTAIDQLIKVESISNYTYVLSNWNTYQPTSKSSCTYTYALALASAKSEVLFSGYRLKYQKSKIGEILYFILEYPDFIQQFSMMMSPRESHVYVAVIMESSVCKKISNVLEVFTCIGDAPVEVKSIETLKHYTNISTKHREYGIAIVKGFDKIYDLEIKPGNFDSFYKALEKTPNKTLRAIKSSTGSIFISFSSGKSK